MQRTALCKQVQSGGTMNATVHTAAAQKRSVGSIDDRVNAHFCNIVSDNLQWHETYPHSSDQCSCLLSHFITLSIPVTIYLPPQFIHHFFYCFFNPFICIFSQCQCQRKLIYNVSCGQFSWIVSPHLYAHLHLRIQQAIGHNIFPLKNSFCRITSDIRCVQHGYRV